MSYALLLRDRSEQRFCDQAELMLDYLKRVGLKGVGICAGILSEAGFEQLFRQIDGAPLLLGYFGHGSREGWSDGGMSYRRLANVLAASTSPVLVVNSCCHSGALIDELKRVGADAGRIGVIASAGTKHVSNGLLAETLVDSWSRGEIFRQRREDVTREYIGTVFSTDISTKVLSNGRIVVDLSFPAASRHELVLNQARIAWRRRFPKTVRIRESRWGAVLDPTYFVNGAD